MITDHITPHAKKRVKQRTSLSYDDLARLLDNSPIIKPLSGINKEYVIIYSAIDKKIYVAIRDVFDGSVVTVWYLWLYEKRYGKISNEIIETAKLKGAKPCNVLGSQHVDIVGKDNYDYPLYLRKTVNIKVHFKGSRRNKRRCKFR